MTKTLGKKNSKSALHPTRIDLSSKVRSQVIELLNQNLADAFDLYSQVKQAHWNVKGHQFYQLHLLFDEMAGELLEHVDEIAERVTTLGGTALGTVRVAAEESRLHEYPLDLLEGLDHIAALAERYAVFGQSVRNNIEQTAELGDADTSDLLTGVSRNADKRLWFLEAHLQAEG